MVPASGSRAAAQGGAQRSAPAWLPGAGGEAGAGERSRAASPPPFLLAKLLFTCLGNGNAKTFFFFLKEFLDAFHFLLYCFLFFKLSFLLEPFDLKKFIVYASF